MNTTKIRKHQKHIAAFAAAAVLFVTGAVSAGAVYTQFTHKAAVQDYFAEGTADYLENEGLALNYTAENEHLRLTVDTLLSDGHIGNMILTFEGLDEAGTDFLNSDPHLFPEIYVSDAETGDYVPVLGESCPNIVSGGGVNFEACTDTQKTMQAEMHFDRLDTEKDYILTFGLRTLGKEEERDEYDVLTNSITEGITLETNFSANVDVKELKNEDGGTIYFSQIGYYTADEDTAKMLLNRHGDEIEFLRSGSFLKDELEFNARSVDVSPEKGQPTACGWFHSIVLTEKYNGMKIGDTEYKETE